MPTEKFNVPIIRVDSGTPKPMAGTGTGSVSPITTVHDRADNERPMTPIGADDGTGITPDRSQSLSSSLPKKKGQMQTETTGDTLTMHILRRTGTQHTVMQKLKAEGKDDGLNSGTEHLSDLQIERQRVEARQRGDSLSTREKKKGVSFLTRIMGIKKNAHDESEIVDGEKRTEGMNAAVFSQPIGFIPQFPAPPKYIRVRSHHKAQRDFGHIFLAQELYREPIYEESGKVPTVDSSQMSQVSLALPSHKSGSIWTMKFSKDGKYLATGGEEKIVRVWAVLSSEGERSEHEEEEENAAECEMGSISNGGRGVRLNAPVFKSEPIREYTGHTHDILDLSWSKNNFLLSSSMDKTVRLWHVTREECLCCFQHSDFVTSLAFHPRDDRFFLAGSLDCKLRLWSIPDKSVAFWTELQDLITAVAFTPDGRIAIAGSHTGICSFYETDGLKYNTQIQLKSSLARNAKYAKITGIETITYPPEDPNGDVKVLISSNDSRVRMYNLRDKSLETKFKGNVNTQCQIRATFSDDAKFIISGSEDRRVYIWNVAPENTEKKDKRPVEFFEAHSAIVTCAVLAPTKTRQLLGSSGDPIYDLCNPPPVTLVSRSDSVASSRRHLDTNTVAVSNPEQTNSTTSTTSSKPKEEEKKVSTRSFHRSGNIIVTADATGRIKVFRQDCAYNKRNNDTWETASTFSRRKASGSIFSNLGRRSSLGEKNSTGRNSMASDISLNGSLRSGRASILQQQESRNRSISPRKSMGALSLGTNGRSSPARRSRAHSVNNEEKPEIPDNRNDSPHLPGPRTAGAKEILVASPPVHGSVSKQDATPTRNMRSSTQSSTSSPEEQRRAHSNVNVRKINHFADHTSEEDNSSYRARPVSQHSSTFSSLHGNSGGGGGGRAGGRVRGGDHGGARAGFGGAIYKNGELEVEEEFYDEDLEMEEEGENNEGESEGEAMVCHRCKGRQFSVRKRKDGQQQFICVRCKLMV